MHNTTVSFLDDAPPAKPAAAPPAEAPAAVAPPPAAEPPAAAAPPAAAPSTAGPIPTTPPPAPPLPTEPLSVRKASDVPVTPFQPTAPSGGGDGGARTENRVNSALVLYYFGAQL